MGLLACRFQRIRLAYLLFGDPSASVFYDPAIRGNKVANLDPSPFLAAVLDLYILRDEKQRCTGLGWFFPDVDITLAGGIGKRFGLA